MLVLSSVSHGQSAIQTGTESRQNIEFRTETPILLLNPLHVFQTAQVLGLWRCYGCSCKSTGWRQVSRELNAQAFAETWQFLLLSRSNLEKIGCLSNQLTLWQVARLQVAATQGGWLLWLDGFAYISTVEFGVTISTDNLSCPDAWTAALWTLEYRDKASEQEPESECRNTTDQECGTAVISCRPSTASSTKIRQTTAQLDSSEQRYS